MILIQDKRGINSAFDRIVDHDSDQMCFENHWIQVAAESKGCRSQFQDDMTLAAAFLYSQSTLYFNMTKLYLSVSKVYDIRTSTSDFSYFSECLTCFFLGIGLARIRMWQCWQWWQCWQFCQFWQWKQCWQCLQRYGRKRQISKPVAACCTKSSPCTPFFGQRLPAGICQLLVFAWIANLYFHIF